MRVINAGLIRNAVKDLCITANIRLRKDILSRLKLLRDKEANSRAKNILGMLINNASIALRKKLPICQDTGMVTVYLKVGQAVVIKGSLKNMAAKGVAEAYKEGYFRKSVVGDPLIRKNTNTNLPPIIYTDITPGNKIDIKVAIKGFGCENVSKIKMFMPLDSISDIEKFVLDTVKEAGSMPCPPIYIGIGIGGTLDKAVFLSREAIFRPIGEKSKKAHIAKLEKSILNKVNKLGIGPMGAGGSSTAMGVSILTYPTHIAGLPVAVNISCHATRTARKVL